MFNFLGKLFAKQKTKSNGTKPSVDWSKGYRAGQEYDGGGAHVDVSIQAFINSPGFINPFDFFLYKSKVSVIQTGATLVISLQRNIPEGLWKNVALSHKGEEYIFGYFWSILPRVNQEILNQKYSKGHLLIHSFSVYDVDAFLLVMGSKKVRLNWPIAIGDFPYRSQKYDLAYIRDFMDACHSYLTRNYDDCIRKVITCTENFFSFHKIKGGGLRDTIKNNIPSGYGAEVIKNNLLFIYKIRNKIVHNNFRINHSNGWFCKRSIGTLQYLLQSPLNKDRQSVKYILDLVGEFQMIDMRFDERIYNLDIVEKRNKIQKPPDESQIIHNSEELNRSVFASLEIKEKDKSIILRK